MIRSEKFLISQKPYAIQLDSVQGRTSKQGTSGRYSFRGSCWALWYRRKNGVTRACSGRLRLRGQWMVTPVDTSSPQSILSSDLDGRYGGDCYGRWDGESFWGDVTLVRQGELMAVLRPMLDSCPEVPPRYDGWWRFGA